MRFRPCNIHDQNEASPDDRVVDFANASVDDSEQELHVNIRLHYLKMVDRDGVIKPTKKI